MPRYWTSKALIRSSAEDLRADERDPSTSVAGNYKESLQTILENCVLILAFSTKFLSNPWLPRKFRAVHNAWAPFHIYLYMTNMYEHEKRALAEGKTTDHNLMTLMIHTSQDDEENSSALTETHSDVHDWLSGEIMSVLKRCQSVMYKTMRLYTPVLPLTVGDKEIILPPDSMGAPSYGSIQTDPKFWGSDSLVWRPSRWIKPSKPGFEEMNMPPRGSFLGWSELEFMATMAVLFREWRVDPVIFRGETIDIARERVVKLIEMDSYAVLLLQMIHPERVPLVWKKA
ncbi:cytochrome P450 [Biscogniauxia sp. FL1348]|nr:cytochrome P450 [Biscogniauxia sp. FL1348]